MQIHLYVLYIIFQNVMNHDIVILLHIFGKRKIKTNNFFASVTKSVVIFRVIEWDQINFTEYCNGRKMRKGGDSQRPYKLIHQIVSLTGINFNTKSIIGIVELTISPNRDNIKDIRLNAKQLLIYKVSLKTNSGQIFEPTFQYGDPMLEVVNVKEDRNM